MNKLILAVLAAALVGAQPAALAGQATAPAAVAKASTARAADVASVDAIIAALYQVISGPAGAPRDWDRMRSLFAPDGKMAAVGPKPDGSFALRSMTVDDYIARNTRHFAEQGFFETELARTSDAFGQLVHVFSTYEARRAPGAAPFVRGINSIQLFNDGSRWWVASVIWRAEDAALPVPERYLKSH
jgi:hypothetical protein